MQKKSLLNITSWVVLVSFTTMHTPSFIYADASENHTVEIEQTETSIPSAISEQTQEPVSVDIDAEDDETAEPQGTLVSPSTNATEKAKGREFFRNILIAGSAVVVAVISILIVSNNNGKKAKKTKPAKAKENAK